MSSSLCWPRSPLMTAHPRAVTATCKSVRRDFISKQGIPTLPMTVTGST
jgi:hypothetical protein